MNSLTRRLASVCAVALTLGLVSGGAMREYAHGGSQMPLAMCPADADPNEESPFLDENAAAMTKMMDGMRVRPTGDVDADFVAMMVPHHQGAIEMAQAVLRHGRNPQIKRLAQEIVVTQQQEIAVMRLAVGQPLPLSTASPTQPSARTVSDTR